MINYFAGFGNRARLTAGRRPASEGGPLEISSVATVSLSENGAVFLHGRSGLVFTSNRIGARIWQGVLDRECVQTIATRISREHGAPREQVFQDTAEFVAELETLGFLSRRAGC